MITSEERVRLRLVSGEHLQLGIPISFGAGVVHDLLEALERIEKVSGHLLKRLDEELGLTIDEEWQNRILAGEHDIPLPTSEFLSEHISDTRRLDFVITCMYDNDNPESWWDNLWDSLPGNSENMKQEVREALDTLQQEMKSSVVFIHRDCGAEITPELRHGCEYLVCAIHGDIEKKDIEPLQ